jgi:vacuolar-type H+-ATPase subunit F/Vma7
MLAGVETEACSTAGSAAEVLNKALHDPELGVLLIDEALLATLDARMLRPLDTSEQPLAITVPLDMSAGAEREHLEKMIQRIIGYQLRLE